MREIGPLWWGTEKDRPSRGRVPPQRFAFGSPGPAARRMAANHIDFELSAAEIDAILTYTPSKEPQETQDSAAASCASAWGRIRRCTRGNSRRRSRTLSNGPPTRSACCGQRPARGRRRSSSPSWASCLARRRNCANEQGGVPRDACGCRYAERRQRRGHCWGGAFQFGVSSVCLTSFTRQLREWARPHGRVRLHGGLSGVWALGLEGKMVKVTFRNRSKTVKVALRTDPSKTVKAPGPPETLPPPYGCSYRLLAQL